MSAKVTKECPCVSVREGPIKRADAAIGKAVRIADWARTAKHSTGSGVSPRCAVTPSVHARSDARQST